MSYELSREHEEFRRSVREFAQAEIAPHAAQWDRDHHFPVDVVQQMGKLGLMGLTAPEEFGGAGEDATRTKAELAGGEWVVNGAKQFITNSGSDLTSVVTVTAKTGATDAKA